MFADLFWIPAVGNRNGKVVELAVVDGTVSGHVKDQYVVRRAGPLLHGPECGEHGVFRDLVVHQNLVVAGHPLPA